jgi:dihydrofolate reductase
MRRLVLYHLLSLDGIALDDDADWFTDGSPELFANLGRVISAQDDVLLGRATYDYWADYWPDSDLEPFAGFINNTPKHVFTSTTPSGQWANTTVVTAPAVEYVADLKLKPGGDIGIHGSISLAASLLRAGLVDVLELAVAPACAGQGRRVFDGGDQRLELTAAEHSPAGTLFLTYRCPSAAGPNSSRS